jgi:hypothetical protein
MSTPESIELGQCVTVDGFRTFYLGRGFYYDPVNANVRTSAGVTATLLNLDSPPIKKQAVKRWARSILLLAGVQTALSVGMSELGSRTSEAKARSSAANGRLGGRPRLNRPKTK